MQGEKSIADVTNPESCARDCYNEGVGSCQSFEYCKDLKACTFNKRHTMDVPSSDIFSSPHCSVYSRKFFKFNFLNFFDYLMIPVGGDSSKFISNVRSWCLSKKNVRLVDFTFWYEAPTEDRTRYSVIIVNLSRLCWLNLRRIETLVGLFIVEFYTHSSYSHYRVDPLRFFSAP